MSDDNDQERVGDLSRRELKRIVDDNTLGREEMRQLVRSAVLETLSQLGVDTSSPIEMQRDFQHLRDWRMAQEVIRRKGYMTLMGILVTGFVGLLWVGFKDVILNLVK